MSLLADVRTGKTLFFALLLRRRTRPEMPDRPFVGHASVRVVELEVVRRYYEDLCGIGQRPHERMPRGIQVNSAFRTLSRNLRAAQDSACEDLDSRISAREMTAQEPETPDCRLAKAASQLDDTRVSMADEPQHAQPGMPA